VNRDLAIPLTKEDAYEAAVRGRQYDTFPELRVGDAKPGDELVSY
jgi:hypothetical protein